MSLPDTPNTQRERYYSVIAGQNGTDILPENPVKTEDRYLDYIARNGGGGGGGGDTKIFTGTMSEWEALTPDEKAEYTHLMTTDTITTLAGYGITDAYTKAEVDALINTETATTLYSGTISGTYALLQLTKSILNFKKLDICLYSDDSKDFVHVTSVPTSLLSSGYDVEPSNNKGVHFFVNMNEPTGNGYMYIPVTGNRTTDFTQIQTQSLNGFYAKITGVK